MIARAACAAGILAALALALIATAGAQEGGLSAQDANYLRTSISGDRFEIIGGKMAQRLGTTAAMQALGHRLVEDHTRSLAEAVAEAKRFGLKIPTAPTPSEVWELQTVASMRGAAFDHAYATLEVKDHQQDIEETAFEVVHGGVAEVKQSAAKELPMLRTHLALSKRAAHSV